MTEGHNDRLQQEVRRLTDSHDRLRAEIERLTRERDVAVKDTDWYLERNKVLSDRAEAADREMDEAKRYASHLAETMKRNYFADSAPFELLPDLVGVLTQVDNMVAGIGMGLGEAERQVATLRKALEFYKNPQKFSLNQDGSNDPIPDFYDELDFGSRARAALAETEKKDDD